MNKFRYFSLTTAAVCVGMGAPLAGFANTSQAKPATISAADARAAAPATVPDGVIQSAELETEHAKKVWSFDIRDPKSANVVEVQVDAMTGAIVSRKVESPRELRKEAQADKRLKR